jgi:hypothetical protein
LAAGSRVCSRYTRSSLFAKLRMDSVDGVPLIP